jgi:hypothetical protein
VAKLPAQIRIQVGAKTCHECFDTLARNLHAAGIVFEVGVPHNNQGLALLYKQKVKRLTGIANRIPVIDKPCEDDGLPETQPVPYLVIYDAGRKDSCIVIPYRRVFDDRGRLKFDADSVRNVVLRVEGGSSGCRT